jgi:hypothetical protein
MTTASVTKTFNDLYKSLFGSLVMVVVAMGAFWLVEGRHYPTRDEMKETIAHEIQSSNQTNPYLSDRQLLIEGISDVKSLRKEMTILNVNIAILSEQIKKGN